MFRKGFVFTPATMALVALFTLFLYLPAANAQQNVELRVEGSIMETDSAPFIAVYRVMVPVREIANALGADVSWNEEKRAVEVAQGEYHLTLFIGERHASVNGKDVQLEVAPVIVKGRAMVPARVLADGLQVPISWDCETQVVSLGKSALVAGSSLDFPPFEYKEGSELLGFEIDLIEAIEEVSGENIIVQDISFDALIPSLRSGKIDMIISGLTIFEQRKEVIAFTTPYFAWDEIILSTKGSPGDITLKDLAGKKIAVQGGSHAQELVNALVEEHPATQLSLYETLEEVWGAVEKGQTDAAVVPYPLAAYYLTKHPDSSLQMVGDSFAGQPIGIAVQKDDQELLEKLNKSLETIMENGTYDRICEKWFGAKHPAL